MWSSKAASRREQRNASVLLFRKVAGVGVEYLSNDA